MRAQAGGVFAALLVVFCSPMAAPALAAGPVGADPGANFPIGSLSSTCRTAPTGAACISASVGYLDQARASLGQPPYSLPADFASLAPDQQALILTNSDRTLYGLPPITGLTAALDQDAASGVVNDSDPQPSTANWYGYTSNAAWGDANMVLAYEGWMYDDGPGSDNLDCTTADPGGCWGHRHDILWQFGPGALAMGAASGTDASGNPSYTMLLLQGSPSFSPVYTYTWAQALGDGAGGSTGAAGSSGSGSSSNAGPTSVASSRSGGGPASDPVARGARAAIHITSLRVRGHRIVVRVSARRGTSLVCSLRSARGHSRRAKPCSHVVVFSRVPAGRYRLRVAFGSVTVTRRVLVR